MRTAWGTAEGVDDRAILLDSLSRPVPVRHGAFDNAARSPRNARAFVLHYAEGRWTEGHPHQALIAIPGASLLAASKEATARILIARYREGHSIAEQGELLAAAGLPAIGRSRIAKWTSHALRLLSPVAEAIRTHGLALHYISAASHSIGSDVRQRLWIYQAADAERRYHATWLRLTPDRLGGYAARELRDFSGVVQAETGCGFDQRWEQPIVRAACWDQIRSVLRAVAPPGIETVATTLEALYQIEDQCRGTDIRSIEEARRARSAPLLDDLHTSLPILASDPANIRTDEIVSMLREHWEALTRYVDNPALEIDTRPVRQALERVIARQCHGAARAPDYPPTFAEIATIIETCEANGTDPCGYVAAALDAVTGSHPQLPMPWHMPKGNAQNDAHRS